jgi:hypothetical protein
VIPDDEDALEAKKFSKTMRELDEILENLQKLKIASEEANTKTKRVVEFVKVPGMDDMQKYFERGV